MSGEQIETVEKEGQQLENIDGEIQLVELSAPDHTAEAVLEIETEDFEQNYVDIEPVWRNLDTLQYLNEKQLEDVIYGFSVGTTYTMSTSMGFVAYSGGGEMYLPFLGFHGWLLSNVAVWMAGMAIGNKINSLETDPAQNFEGEYRRVDDFDNVKNLLQNSEAVSYEETRGLPWSTDDPTPETAARDYRDLIELLEAENEEYKRQRASMLDDILSEGQRHLVDNYDPDEDNTDLVDLEELDNLSETHRELIENIEKDIAETQVNQLIRIKNLENPEYSNAYRLEVYQGSEDLKFSVKGITDQEIDFGYRKKFLDSIA